MKYLIPVFSALVLTGCATEAAYIKILDGWIGAPDAELVRAWGAPNGTYETGGEKFLTYRRSSHETTRIGNMIVTDHYDCETTFTVRDGRIHEWRFKGNDCRAEPQPSS